jgi:site-specific DNA recombinase
MNAAIYARLSVDEDGKDSVAVQVVLCRAEAERRGLTVDTVHVFSDEVSGAAVGNRPGFKALMQAAERRQFATLIVRDLERVARSVDLGPICRDLDFWGVRLIGLDGSDSTDSSFRLKSGLSSVMSVEFIEKIRTMTRLSHRARAQDGHSTGGRAFGYTTVPVDPSNPRSRRRYVIDESAAAVVRRIFDMYADGHSLVGIAARLNNEGIASPGARWKRTKRRADAKWLNSAIFAIINNPIYIGRVIWGRSTWVKHPRTGVRTRRDATAGTVERTEESLRIVSQELWDAVKARQAKQSATAGERVRAGLQKKARAGDCGRQRHLLSGLLRCGTCHSGFQMTNKVRYQCSSHHNGGDAACPVALSVLRDRLEERVIDHIETELLVPGRLAELEERLRSSAPIVVDYAPRITELAQREKNLAAAIAEGGDMSALLAALKSTQAERERIERAASAIAPALPIPSPVSYERRVEELKAKLAEGGDVARAAVAEITGGAIMLDLDDSGRFFWAIFEDGVRAALLADAELMGVAYSDPSVFGKVESSGSGGVICTNSTAVVHFPNIDRRKTRREEIPSHCGRGHPLTPDNLRIDQSEQRWRCLQCGRERATAFRRRHHRAA